jgi:hypothetical protein
MQATLRAWLDYQSEQGALACFVMAWSDGWVLQKGLAGCVA